MSSITALMESFLMDQQLSVIQVNTYVHGSLGRVQSNIRQVSGDKSCFLSYNCSLQGTSATGQLCAHVEDTAAIPQYTYSLYSDI